MNDPKFKPGDEIKVGPDRCENCTTTIVKGVEGDKYILVDTKINHEYSKETNLVDRVFHRKGETK